MYQVSIDPGTHESAIVILDENKMPKYFAILENEKMVEKIYHIKAHGVEFYNLSIEMVACYGMSVGKEIFETCVWIGRFREAWGHTIRLIYRQEVKMYLCRTNRAKDANIRQALIDMYGLPGTKSKPGKLYGIKSHIWAALAVAVYSANTK